MVLQRPPFDPELELALAGIGEVLPSSLTLDMALEKRQAPPAMTPDLLDELGVESRDVEITSFDGVTIELTILHRKDRTGDGPGILYTHGGGMVMGDRWLGLSAVLPAVIDFNAVIVTVEYRLAPEHPDPTPVEDCYAALNWTAEQSGQLGIAPGRLLIAGSSAGGGLAAGCALLARDRGGPQLIGQMLMYPMLDDRNDSVSSHQIDGVGVWDRHSNQMGWEALLGDRRGTDHVSIYAAPGRATDLSGLPPTFIDCGSAEVFRDEDIAYASSLWAAGGQVELHVWPGAFHGFDSMAPASRLAQQAVQAQRQWLAALLSR